MYRRDLMWDLLQDEELGPGENRNVCLCGGIVLNWVFRLVF